MARGTPGRGTPGRGNQPNEVSTVLNCYFALFFKHYLVHIFPRGALALIISPVAKWYKQYSSLIRGEHVSFLEPGGPTEFIKILCQIAQA